jgi:hypothetical protein
MSADHAPEVAKPQEELHGQAAVHQTVVYQEVSRPKQAHAHPETEGHFARPAGASLTAEKDEGDGGGSVQDRQGVVGLEPLPGWAQGVMRAMNRPEKGVPYAPVEKSGPQVHGDGDHGCDRKPDQGSKDELAQDVLTRRAA